MNDCVAQAIEPDWAQAHAADIAAYNQWASTREPYAQRVRRWRAEQLGDDTRSSVAEAASVRPTDASPR